MKATFDGTTVLNIEYSDKEIKRCFNSYTREMEWDCYWYGKYVGTANSNQEAHAKLDALAYEELSRRTTEETDDAELTNACGGFGCVDGCANCVQVAA